MERAEIEIEVVLSPTAGRVDRVRLMVPAGTTALQALSRSGLLERHPHIEPDAGQIGIHGRHCAPSQALRNGDRVELYRALRVDPKDARRERYRGQSGRKPR